jgi:hypothetical protein
LRRRIVYPSNSTEGPIDEETTTTFPQYDMGFAPMERAFASEGKGMPKMVNFAY